MQTHTKECIIDVKCDSCGTVIKNIDDKYSIIYKYSQQEIVMCKYCFLEFKKEISNIWIHI